ncbi:MAG: ABC transporter substrate-binding protein [Candidatus Thorarchaeota archaeon]
MRKVKAIVAITIIFASSIAAVLILLSMNANPPDSSDGPFDVVYNQAPMLDELVENGTLPPVEGRLPTNPVLIQPHDEIGVYGGTWRIGGVNGPSSNLLRTYFGYETLLRWDPAWSRIIPNVAQSYTTNEDASEFTFHLREGLKWSDGINFTADDILFWYEAYFLNANLTSALNTEMRVNNTYVVVEKIDNYTIKFNFAGSYGLFPFHIASLGADEITSCPMHYMKQFHIDYNPEGIDALIEAYSVDDWVQLWHRMVNVQNNPDIPTLNTWVLTSWAFAGDTSYIILERNPYYWKIDSDYNQLPYIDRINYTFYSSSDELKSAMLNGSIDMQHRGFNIGGHYDDFVANMDIGNYSLHKTLNTRDNYFTIQLNLLHKDPVLRSVFSNKTFRIALSHAINRTAIIEEVVGQDLDPRQPAPRIESPNYREKLANQYLDFNLTLANELLDSAGYDDRDIDGYRLTPTGHRINFTISVTEGVTGVYYRAATMLCDYWHDLGLIVNVTAIDAWPITQLTRANDHDALIQAAAEGYTSMFLSPTNYVPLSEYSSRWAIPWVYWYANNSLGEEPPVYVKEQFNLYEQLQSSVSESEMIVIMDQILEIAEEQFYMMGICLNLDGYMLVRSNFHNVPDVMPRSWTYPTPAPTNPCQYFMDSQNSSGVLSEAQSTSVISHDALLHNSVLCGNYLVTKEQ